jgi:hypothetical protein
MTTATVTPKTSIRLLGLPQLYAVQPAAPWPVLAALLAAVMALAWSSGACVYIGLDQRDPRRHDRP